MLRSAAVKQPLFGFLLLLFGGVVLAHLRFALSQGRGSVVGLLIVGFALADVYVPWLDQSL